MALLRRLAIRLSCPDNDPSPVVANGRIRIGLRLGGSARLQPELDRDIDAGGERRLLQIEMPGDEALVCVSVRCPSTGHHFVLRVPPDMTSCHQAVAWTAGYDDPAQYRPVVES